VINSFGESSPVLSSGSGPGALVRVYW
jgi:hypothetical protein